MNGRRCVLAVGIAVAGWMATGCANIVSGHRQDLTVTSQPTALCVTINGEPYGATPVVASLLRGKQYVVQVHNLTYIPYEQTVVPVTNNMIWGNFAFGWIIGLMIDSVTPAAYEHSTSQVNAYFPVPMDQRQVPKECQESAEAKDAKQLAMQQRERDQAIFPGAYDARDGR